MRDLDAGIRATVEMLMSAGFRTGDSGDGVSKPADERVFHVPHVAASVDVAVMASEAERMAGILGPEWSVQASYSTADQSAVLLAMKGTEPPRVCANCDNLKGFDLADDIKTCPVLNIRLHATTIQDFGCSLWEPLFLIEVERIPVSDDQSQAIPEALHQGKDS
jgi:hypothetical protein